MVTRTDPRALAMPEDKGSGSLEAGLLRLMADLGLYGFHARNSRGCTGPGWPDWVIVGHRVLYRELKSEAGRLSPDQRAVADRLIKAGADWAVWRPTQLLDGTIARELAELAAIQTHLFA